MSNVDADPFADVEKGDDLECAGRQCSRSGRVDAFLPDVEPRPMVGLVGPDGISETWNYVDGEFYCTGCIGLALVEAKNRDQSTLAVPGGAATCDNCGGVIRRVLLDRGGPAKGFACRCTSWADRDRTDGIYVPWSSDLPDRWFDG